VGFSPRKQRLIRNLAKCKASGAKAPGTRLAARLKPCPDTKHIYAQGFDFRKSWIEFRLSYYLFSLARGHRIAVCSGVASFYGCMRTKRVAAQRNRFIDTVRWPGYDMVRSTRALEGHVNGDN